MENSTINRFSFDENRSTRRVKRRTFNSQICFAYLLSVVAVTLIVGGVYMSYIYWNKLWLTLAVIGIVVNLFGSCFYYNGSNQLYDSNEEHIYENRTRRRRYRTRGLSTDQLMPSAPPLNQSQSVSQFSLNMIPQYFCSNESEVISVANESDSTSVTPLTTFSQIFSINGQSYLILPLTGEPLNASNSLPLQNLMVRMTDETKFQNSNLNELRNKTESKKIECESQSSQTDNDLKKSRNGYRDVQLQTLSRTQLDQIDSQVINCGPQTSRSVQLMQSTSGHNTNGFVIELNSTDSSSQESQDNSLEPFGSEMSNGDTQTVVTLIDLNDDNNGCTSSDCNQRQSNTQTQESCSQNLVNYDFNQTSLRVDESVENQEFNSFSNDNINEEHIDDCMSVPPPSYEDVVDYSDAINDDQPIIVDYGTL